MAHNVETMAYAGQVPWHGLGFAVADNLTVKQMLKAAKLDWTVSKRQLSFPGANGKPVDYPDWFSLTRDSDNRPLTMVGKKYKPVQNAQAMEFFREFCEAGKMKLVTAGSLYGGRYVWALAEVNHGHGEFDVKSGKTKDHMKSYVLLMSPHVAGKSLLIKFTSVRVVCWNTLCMALGGVPGTKQDKSAFRMPHTLHFDDKMQQKAKEALGLAQVQADAVREAAQFLASHKARKDDVDAYFGDVLNYAPSQRKQVAGSERVPRMLPMFQDALERAPGANLNTAKGTWWGALNAVTYVIDHEFGNTRDTALRSAWFGPAATMKREALRFALERAS